MNEVPLPPMPEIPSLFRLDELGRVYASNYVGPHYMTFTVEGLRNLLAELNAPVQDEKSVAQRQWDWFKSAASRGIRDGLEGK